MENARQGEYSTLTRYVRPVESISFTGQEMLGSLMQAVHPATLTTVNQLHGERKGVVRMTFRSEEAAADFDQRLASRKLHINGVRIAGVGDAGQFMRVTLQDVPEYLSSLDIERELRQYGSVAHVRREYIEFRGHRIENETRHVLFSHIAREIPQRVQIEGHSVFVTSRHGTFSRNRDDNAADVPKSTSFPPRPPSRQSNAVADVTPVTSDATVQVQTTPHGTPRPERRAPSPMVGTQTETPPEISASRPRHVMASPKPYRRASLGGPLCSDSRVHFRVEAQVQTDDIPRNDIPSFVNRWNNYNSNNPGGPRKYYNHNESRHPDHQDDCRSQYDCETKL